MYVDSTVEAKLSFEHTRKSFYGKNYCYHSDNDIFDIKELKGYLSAAGKGLTF